MTDKKLGNQDPYNPTHCWNCGAALTVFSTACAICGTGEGPYIIDYTTADGTRRSGGGHIMANDWSRYSLNGCLFETSPKPAPELRTPDVNLPRVIDLRIHCPPVEDQLETNSCVANAVVGALEFHQKKAGLPLTDLSRLFVYYNARSLSEMENQDSGSLIHHGMAAVLAYGACEASKWPFRQTSVTQRPGKDCYENATRYEAVQYARTPVGDPALKALANGLPVVFGMYAPMDYYDIAAQTGVMPKPQDVYPTRPPSGHAMLIVGYDLDDKTYLVRNSWSERWADKGYFRVPFETMEAWSKPEDFWTIGAIEQAEGFKLTGPSMVETMQGLGLNPQDLEVGGKKLDRLRSDLRSRLSSDLETAKRDFRSRLRDK